MDQKLPLIKTELHVQGMSTINEEIIVTRLLMQIDGIVKVYAHHKTGKAEIYSSGQVDLEQLQQAFEGYNFKIFFWRDKTRPGHKIAGDRPTSRAFLKFIALAIIVIGAYFIFRNFNLAPQTQNVDSKSLWVIFLTGLTVGGLTCLAVQGGLLASVIAEREEEGTMGKGTAKHAIYATCAFLVSKFIAYAILGFLLGAFGGVLNIGGKVQIIMQLAAGFYMVAVALNLLNIHPIFRYVIIQPPRFLTRLVKNQSKSKDIFAPALLGTMTVFIPCGTTLAMEALAISSVSAFSGATIMSAFILGTMPLFFGIGIATSIMGEAFKVKFLKLAAVAVIYLGISSINGSLVALSSPLTLQSLVESFPSNISLGKSNNNSDQNIDIETTQNAQIDVTSYGYKPNYIRVKKNQEVTLTLNSKDAYSCASAFRIPSMGISRDLAATGKETITFTPTKSGKIKFNCSMGMYRGIIEVI